MKKKVILMGKRLKKRVSLQRMKVTYSLNTKKLEMEGRIKEGETSVAEEKEEIQPRICTKTLKIPMETSKLEITLELMAVSAAIGLSS